MARIYLEFNPPINDTFGNQVRYEFLDLERYIDPKDDNQKELNKEVDDLAEGYRCDRYLSMIRTEHSSFIAMNRQDGDFLEYFDRIPPTKESSSGAASNISRDSATRNASSTRSPLVTAKTSNHIFRRLKASTGGLNLDKTRHLHTSMHSCRLFSSHRRTE